MIGGIAVSAIGGVLVLLTLRDMFHTLWHPSGQGRLADLVIRAVWRSTRGKAGSRPRGVSGPLAVVAVIVAWASLLTTGFALVYLPHMPDDFLLASGIDVSERSNTLDAFYLSLVTLATLGYGDIVPSADWLRVVVPAQAFSGFALFTAAVSWALQVYPVLGRRRSLALRLSVLDSTGYPSQVASLDSPAPAALLQDLAGEFAQVRVDVHHYSETAYFRDPDEALSLAHHLGCAMRLTEAAASSRRADVRAAGGVLECALDDLARVLSGHFGGGDGNTREVIAAFARAHAAG